MFFDDTIAAIATAPGEAGVGIVRVSGDKALSILNRIFVPKSKGLEEDYTSRRLIYGHIHDPETDKRIDEVLVAYMKAPFTYTREDVVEINCHGGMIPVKRILELVLRNGARMAEGGEFTKRAFLNGRIDLAQAEAVMDLISAKTERGFDVALEQLEGSLSSEIRRIRGSILELLAHIEVSIDFSEEDVDEVTLEFLLDKSQVIEKELRKILDTADTGKIIREGLNTVIVGKPNVGKSSLMNALLKESRAIVTDIPGTTRDIIEEQLSIRGILLRLMDTAGIRETVDVVEKIGVERTKAFFNRAELVIFVLDASTELSSEDMEIMGLLEDKRVLAIVNKTDLPMKLDLSVVEKMLKNKKLIRLSLTEKTGLEEVENAIVDMVFGGEIRRKEQVMVTNVRHRNSLEKALHSLNDGISAVRQKLPLDFIEVDYKNAWEYLGEITGDSVGEDLLDHIFSNFCIGK